MRKVTVEMAETVRRSLDYRDLKNLPRRQAPTSSRSALWRSAKAKSRLQSVSFYPSEFKNEGLPRSAFIGLNRVVTIGETLPGVGPINSVEGFDIINRSGQIVFTDGEKVVRC